MKISFVIPCYNSEKNIEKVVEEIISVVLQRDNYDYEFILVNDFSKDATEATIKKLSDKNSTIISISLARNFGQPNAILAGFQFATGDYIVVSDDDGQTPIDTLYSLIDELEKGKYDVVCGKYIDREQPSLFRRFGSKLNEKMSNWLIKKPENIYMSAYLVARPFVIKEIMKYKNPYPYISGLILRVTQNIGNVEVKQRGRKSGNSGYTFSKLLKLWINGFTAFSLKPLRISVLIGILFSFSGFIFGLITMIRKILNVNIQAGWSSIICINLIIGGVILLFLGMIGEYIGRIYMCINEQPQYVIKDVYQTTNSENTDFFE